MLSTIANIILLKTGLMDRAFEFLNQLGKPPSEARTYKLGHEDARIFESMHERINKTLNKPTSTRLSGHEPIFQEQVMPFTQMMVAAREFIVEPKKASKNFAVYLTLDGDVAKTSYYLLEIRNNDQKPIMSCTITGLR